MFYVYVVFYHDYPVIVYPSEDLAAAWVANEYKRWPTTPEGAYYYKRAELRD